MRDGRQRLAWSQRMPGLGAPATRSAGRRPRSVSDGLLPLFVLLLALMVGLLAARPVANGARSTAAPPPTAAGADAASAWPRPVLQAEALASLQRFLADPPSATAPHGVPAWQVALPERVLLEATTPPVLRAPVRVLLFRLARFLADQRADTWSLTVVGASADQIAERLELVRAELLRLGAPERRVVCGFNAALGDGVTLLRLERRAGDAMVSAR